MPKQVREHIAITTVIKGILDNYPAGAATLREFLQNTDDCGATVQDFILDTRSFSTDRLIDPTLANCQGPALIAANDGVFQTTDWEAITKINASSKTKDETSTGKFGLGFRSCYHITDTPQILSGDRFYILDPHESMERFPGGVNLATEGDDRDIYSSHFDAFASVLPHLCTPTLYNGTAIRLPLRLESQAQTSQIKNTATSISDIRQMFEDFASKDLSEALLFLKHITSISLSEVGSDNVHRLLARAWIENSDALSPERSRNRGREQEMSYFEMTIHLEVGDVTTSRRWLVSHFVEDYSLVQSIMAERLGRPKNDIGVKFVAEKLLPHVALALPIPSSLTSMPLIGKLFTLLPLPITTDFPLHLHGVLALTSSRQNLRNSHDVAPRSREQFLVEWNRTIFADLAPKAWAGLLEHMTKLPYSLRPYTVWPNVPASMSGDQAYWKTLPNRLLEFAALKSVWSVSGGNADVVRYLPLEETLVAPPDFDEDLIEALKLCEVAVTCPPRPIYDLIVESEKFSSVVMSPTTVHQRLKRRGVDVILSHLEKKAIRKICDYIVSGNDLNLLLGLRLIPTIGGRHVSITLREKHTYALATAEEAKLFCADDSGLLSLEDMAPMTVQLLSMTDHVQYLQPDKVLLYLSRRFVADVSTADLPWLVDFWSWFGKWEPASRFLLEKNLSAAIQKLRLLPTQVGFRRCSSFAINPLDASPHLLQVFEQLKLPVLHPSVISRGSVIEALLRSPHDVAFLLKELSNRTMDFSSLDQPSRDVLHSHFSRCLSSRVLKLNKAQKKTLRLFPIFPVIPAGARQPQNHTFDVAPSSCRFVDGSLLIIPNIPGTPFIDTVVDRHLMTALQCTVTPESTVLEIAINNWTQQDFTLAQSLVQRIMNRMNDLSSEARDAICDLPIVDVGLGESNLRPPISVVDPKSCIASLYDQDEGVLPDGLFAHDVPGSYLQQLRNYEMLQNTLSSAIIADRIDAIINPTQDLEDKEEKALKLLKLVEKQFDSVYSPHIVEIITKRRWLPASGDFYPPSECWDMRSSDMPLCDLVLHIVATTVRSNRLRMTLGWSQVNFDIMKQQFLKALAGYQSKKKKLGTKKNNIKRIVALLHELADRYKGESCSDSDIDDLLDSIGSQAWIPVSVDKLHPAERTILHPVDLGPTFRQVHSSLLDDETTLLLRQMGVLERPSPEILSSILFSMSQESCPDIEVALKILEELSWRIPCLDPNDTWVPTTELTLQPANSVLYDDIGVKSGLPDGYYAAHPSVSIALATKLGLIFLSHERFSQDESEFDTFNISEDLPTRIKGVLKDYDIEYVCNEWVANADDAKANQVSLLVDEQTFGTSTLLAPTMSEFQQCPALVIHNNATFSDADFVGLGSIGSGGKGETPDKIGRFGLGALTFYHFTELPMVVSANSVLFLDPSESYLPRTTQRNGAKRAGIRMSLEFCRFRYPDQLMPLHGLFEFTVSESYYNGTLFRLPLRTVSQSKKSKLSDSSFSALDIHLTVTKFYHLAAKSLFFSRIDGISALRRAPDGHLSPMWSVRGKRCEHTNETTITKLTLELCDDGQSQPEGVSEVQQAEKVKPGPRREESWLITTSQKQDLEPQFLELARKHRLPPPSVSIALPVTSGSNAVLESRLFATLPLPIATSLPVHLHARWILSRDRRSVHYVAADATGERPLESVYNEYLLNQLVPPLYFDTLAALPSMKVTPIYRYWPTTEADGISSAVVKAFYKYFHIADQHICQTVGKTWIAPKDALFHPSRASGAGSLLTELRIPNFVRFLPEFERSLVDWKKLRVDDASEIAQLLRHHSEEACRVLTGDSSLRKVTDSEIGTILKHLLDEKINLVGIPLLQLDDGKTTTFGSLKDSLVFASHFLEIAQLFGKGRVVGPAISRDPRIIDHLVQADINVRKLQPAGFRQLLAQSKERIVPGLTKDTSTSPETIKWYKDIMRFLHDIDSVKLADVDDLPLIPTMNHSCVVSLDHAQTGGVLWQSLLVYHRCPTAALIAHGVTIINDRDLSFLSPTIGDVREVVRAILDAFQQVQGSLDRLSRNVRPQEWSKLAEWIRQSLTGINLSQMGNLHTLARLPLFNAKCGAEPWSLRAAHDLVMLPPQLTQTTLDDVTEYLQPTIVFAPFSLTLKSIFLASSRKQHELTPEQFLERLRIPPSVTESDEHSYHCLLRLIVNLHPKLYNAPFIPDEDRVLRRPNEIYDHRIEVFANAFQGRSYRFVYQPFRSDDLVMNGLVALGLRAEIGSEELIDCASALHEDAENDVITTERANQFWGYFISRDASSITQDVEFSRISDLRFIPANDERHPYFASFANVLPSVVSPNQVVLSSELPVVWTQRAPFAEEPSRFLTAIMPLFGVPTAPEVVSHLVALATEIAPRHSSDMRVLADIKATYDWLSNHLDEAKPELQSQCHQPIWLNIEDPDADESWTWRPADQLVFDISFDGESGRYDVKSFLSQFKPLLLAAGARAFVHAQITETPRDTDQASHLERLRQGWNRLRETQHLFDIQFNVGGEIIKAHKGMLAAVLDHFMTALTGGFLETNLMPSDGICPVYPLPTVESAFAVRSVIDYVYKGSFSAPACSTIEEAESALTGLLDLLDLANIWEIPELLAQAESMIVNLKLIRKETWNTIHERARASQATRLVEACCQNKEENAWAGVGE